VIWYLEKIPNTAFQGFLTCHIKSGFSILLVPKRGKMDDFLRSGYQGNCAERHHSNFHGWETLLEGHIIGLSNYLGLQPYNELFFD
jgi:hypothetical protein